MTRTVFTPNAPAPIGPYSQAIHAGNTIYVSGQIAINPENGELEMETLQIETTRVMDNLKSVLEAGGFSLNDVVKCTIFLTDMAYFAEVNEIYGSYFNVAKPARETVQVAGLPKGVRVEISAIAIQ